MSGKDGTVVAGDEDAVSFCVEYAKSGRSKCKFGANCKEGELIAEGKVRLGTVVPNPFSSKADAVMTVWWHVGCLFESQRRGRANKRRIQSTSEIEGFDTLKEKDQNELENLVSQESGNKSEPTEWTYLVHCDGVKWWKIGINEDHSTMTKYGEIGSDGFVVTKTFETRNEAEKYLDKAVKGKLTKSAGYEHGVEGAVVSAPPPTASAPATSKPAPKATKASKASAAPAEAPAPTPAPVPVAASAPAAAQAAATGGGAEDIFGYRAEYAKTGRSGCQQCKEKIAEKTLRLAKLVQNPFVDHESIMPAWFHPTCLFENLKRGKQKRTQLTDASAMEGYESLTKDDQALIATSIAALGNASAAASDAKEQGIHLKNTLGDANKYWQISLDSGPSGDGCATLTKWGENADGLTEGNYSKKDFDTAAQALAHRDKMVKSKLKGGYHVWSVEGVKVEESERDTTKEAWMAGGIPAAAADNASTSASISTKKRPAASDEKEKASGVDSKKKIKTEKAVTSAVSVAESKPDRIPDDLKSMKLPELKALCNAHGLSIAGKKDDMVTRLNEAR